MGVAAGAVAGAERVRVVGDAMLVVIILDGSLDRLLGQHRAMDLVGGQAVQRLHHRLVGEGERLFNGLALDHLGGHAAGGDGRPAAEGVKLYVGDDPVFYLDIHTHDVAAFGVAHLADAVGVLHFAQVTGVLKVVHDLFTV